MARFRYGPMESLLRAWTEQRWSKPLPLVDGQPAELSVDERWANEFGTRV
ncbi:hypothetical protein ACQEVC_09360 [Plantactinospora sp. CA-294935]